MLTVGSYTGMKPKEIDFSGDSGNVVQSLTWSTWSASGATGNGTSYVDDCIPSCAQGQTSLVPATIALSDPISGRFTKMTETRNGSTSTVTYPSAAWPVGAS